MMSLLGGRGDRLPLACRACAPALTRQHRSFRAVRLACCTVLANMKPFAAAGSGRSTAARGARAAGRFFEMRLARQRSAS